MIIDEFTKRMNEGIGMKEDEHGLTWLSNFKSLQR